ncbi:MAG: hypothetical protein LJE83_06965 [Gammaproteobacteria bacterium]|jgi:hypothetical protein|nr:hypothetical protein [Gammaproteobacteria bacterium]
MAAGSELHIIVPGLCGPLAEIQSLKNNPDISRWIKVLSRASCTASSPGIHHVLASIFDLSIDGDFPSAALSLLATAKYAASMNYMCADPVYLQADLERAILTSSADLDICESEAAALCDVLNAHFKQDGLCFIREGINSWFVASKDRILINTTALSDAVGRNVNYILPQGDSSAFWKQVMTEAQMLMHSHDINDIRERRGMPAINSLWFHGSGELPEAAGCRVTSVCSDDDVFKGLASHVQCDYLPLTASVDEYLDYLLSSAEKSVNVLHLGDLEQLVNYTDVTPWLGSLSEVLDEWIYPVIKMANKNNIKVMLYPCNEKQYQISKYDGMKFWRQQKLEEHVNSY